MKLAVIFFLFFISVKSFSIDKSLLENPVPYIFNSKIYSCKIDNFELEADLDIDQSVRGCEMTGMEDKWEMERRIRLRTELNYQKEVFEEEGHRLLDKILDSYDYQTIANDKTLRERVKCLSTMIRTEKNKSDGYYSVNFVEKELKDIFEAKLFTVEEFKSLFQDHLMAYAKYKNGAFGERSWNRNSSDFQEYGNLDYPILLYSFANSKDLEKKMSQEIVQQILRINQKDSKKITEKIFSTMLNYLMKDLNVELLTFFYLSQNTFDSRLHNTIFKLFSKKLNPIQDEKMTSGMLNNIFVSKYFSEEEKCEIFSSWKGNLIYIGQSPRGLERIKPILDTQLKCIQSVKHEFIKQH